MAILDAVTSLSAKCSKLPAPLGFERPPTLVVKCDVQQWPEMFIEPSHQADNVIAQTLLQPITFLLEQTTGAVCVQASEPADA